MQGWMCDTSKAKKYEDLPLNARKYVEKIKELCGVKISYVSVGPDREQTINLNE